MNDPFLLLGRLEKGGASRFGKQTERTCDILINPLPCDSPPPKSSAFDALYKAITKLLLPTGNVQVMLGVVEEPRRASENQP